MTGSFLVSTWRASRLGDVYQCCETWKPGFGKEELANSGGWWRQAHRKDAKKAVAVLADVLCAVKEGRVTVNPGAMAVDLWNRLP